MYFPCIITFLYSIALFSASLHNTSIRIGSDGVSVICGDDLDNTTNDESSTANDKNENAVEQESGDKDATGKCDEKTSSESEAEHLGKGITFLILSFDLAFINDT